jgi:hypothetical protein
MKPEKCYTYFLSYWYNCRRAKLRLVKALSASIAPTTLLSGKISPSYLRVPLPGGTSAPIPTLCNKDASLMLGIYFGPTSGSGTHICKMAKKGFIWVDRIKSRPLPLDLAWKSFTHQLQPGMMWGIATIVMSPHRLLKQFQQVYFRCLPLLNVNCNIDLPLRFIPEQYQGLGMANYASVSLASKLSFLQFNWGFKSPHSSALIMVYKSFMIKVGLYGNTMDYDYKTHSMLATSNTWFKNIWELVWYFNVRIHVSAAFQLRAVCRGDISLMSEFMCTGNFSKLDLISLNIMRMHKKVIHKSDIVLCDGKTIKTEMLTDQPEHSDVH